MRQAASAIVILTAFATPASAATITALNNQSLVVDTAPARVADRAFGNDDHITVAFNEQSGVTLATDMLLGGVALAAGTRVDSHLLYHDRASVTPATDYYTSLNSFSFSEKIIAVIMETTELNDTHSVFGSLGSQYLTAYGWFGLETDEQQELVYTDFTLASRFTVNGGFDAVRVLTAPALVPLPATGLMLLGAVGGLGMMRRRQA